MPVEADVCSTARTCSRDLISLRRQTTVLLIITSYFDTACLPFRYSGDVGKRS